MPICSADSQTQESASSCVPGQELKRLLDDDEDTADMHTGAAAACCALL